jgi:hypothetical protein
VKPSQLKILEFVVGSFGYKINEKAKEDYLPDAKDITFKVKVYENKKQKNKHRVDFSIVVGKNKSPARLELEGFSILDLPENLEDEKNDEWLTLAVFPMIYSTLRGYITAVTSNFPISILLPLVDMIKSLDEIGYIEESAPKEECKKNSK